MEEMELIPQAPDILSCNINISSFWPNYQFQVRGRPLLILLSTVDVALATRCRLFLRRLRLEISLAKAA